MTRKKMSPVLFLVASLLTVSANAARFPESRAEELFPYRGPELADSWAREGESPSVGLYIGKGTWSTGKAHLKMFLAEHGISYRTLTAQEVLDGEIASSQIETLIMPGGESWEYLKELGEVGATKIRDFVREGGGYVGICAGAFYATSLREGGYATGPYGIGLLEGTAYDGTALGTKPFIEGMMDFPLVGGDLTAGLVLKPRIVLLGGPSFRYSSEEATKKGIRVVSEFTEIEEPSMITLSYGKGEVFLSGPHLEIEEDRTDWGEAYFDPESDWPLLLRAVKQLH